MAKKKELKVQEVVINWQVIDEADYISLTDMANWDGDPNARARIQSWLKNNSTVRFLELWEEFHNPNFNYSQMTAIKVQIGENAYVLSPKKWIEQTHAIGIVSKAGRYGGTYAHRDIAFEFASWLSPEFKFYLIKEFQRLKTEEAQRLDQEWNYSRFLTKVNYSLHTDSIKRNIVPRLGKGDKPHAFSSEADLLNVAVFGMTAKEYREQFPDAKGNLREGASIRQLTVLANMESMNSHLIEAGASQEARFAAIYKEAQRQLEVFEEDRRLGE